VGPDETPEGPGLTARRSHASHRLGQTVEKNEEGKSDCGSGKRFGASQFLAEVKEGREKKRQLAFGGEKSFSMRRKER